jgi:hypothetical protein
MRSTTNDAMKDAPAFRCQQQSWLDWDNKAENNTEVALLVCVLDFLFILCDIVFLPSCCGADLCSTRIYSIVAIAGTWICGRR